MRLMTFNLRFATPLDGPNEWEFRKDLVVEVIRQHRSGPVGHPGRHRAPCFATWRSIWPATCR